MLSPDPPERFVAFPVATSARPRLSWVVPAIRNGHSQTGYEILAGTSTDPIRHPNLWKSGLIQSIENHGIKWQGEPLVPGLLVNWAVRVEDEHGMLSEWSETVQFAVPPLTVDDWIGRWLAIPPTKAARIDFACDADPVRAMLHFAGQGLLRAAIDGVVINADARDPSDTARTRVAGRSYDVTACLDGPRKNHSLAFVGVLGHHHEVLDAPRLIAELWIYSSDGSIQRITTSDQWKVAQTSLLSEDPFYEEVHDTTVNDDWLFSETSQSHWTPVTVLGSQTGSSWALPTIITPDAGPPVRVVREVKAVSRNTGPIVYDIGTNVAARSRISLRGTHAGQVITVVHGEMLSNDGKVDNSNLHLPWDPDRERQVLQWTCSGGAEILEPWFIVPGCRYIEILGRGEAEILDVTARILHSAVEVVASFSSSDPLLDRLVAQAAATQLNNTHAHPEDCPTREHGGWTGDASVSAEAALSHLDITAVYRNWLMDVIEDQRRDGGVLGVSPLVQADTALQPADPVWGSAITEIPWQMWRHDGDIGAIEPLFPAMRRWCDWQMNTIDEGVVRHADISYGADWLAPKQTPPVLLQTAAVVRSLLALADLEEASCNHQLAALRSQQAYQVKASARKVLWDSEDGVWGNGSQGSYGTALSSGLVDNDEIELVRNRLARMIDENNGRLSTGYSATQSVVRALSNIDSGSRIHKMIHEPSQPGVGAMLVEGPGTFWETWWIKEPQLGIASLDHIGLAAPFAAWAWTNVAGIRPLDPGYRQFSVDLGSLIECLDVQIMTVRGEIKVCWSRSALQVKLYVTVPVGAIAIVMIPRRSKGDISLAAGQHDLTLSVEPELVPVPLSPLPPSRTSLWLSGHHDISEWAIDDQQSSLCRITDRWVCSPCFHEPIDGDVIKVTHLNLAADEERWAYLLFEPPVELVNSRFIFVHVDLDDMVLRGRLLIPTLRVRTVDGVERTGTTRLLPVAWNRLAIDTGNVPMSICEVAVGIRWSKDHDIARGPNIPPPSTGVDLTMMISRLGYSSAKRTW